MCKEQKVNYLKKNKNTTQHKHNNESTRKKIH